MAVVANSAKVESGKVKLMHLPKTASSAILSGTLVSLVAGYVIQATTTAGATDTPLLGVYVGAGESASDATNALVPVMVPAEPLVQFRIVVGTGTLAATDVGKSFDLDADAEVTVSTTLNEPVTCSKFISGTEGLFILSNLSNPAA